VFKWYVAGGGRYRFEQYPRAASRRSKIFRFDLAFEGGTDRLQALNDLSAEDPLLAIPIGGQLRTVVDWWDARAVAVDSVSGWEPVSDPAAPDIPLYLEFTCQAEGPCPPLAPLRDTAHSLIPWRFLHATNATGSIVNTQFFWVRSLPPDGYRTTAPIIFVPRPPLVAGGTLYFDVEAFRRQYGWNSAAYASAADLIRRLDGGEPPAQLQYDRSPSCDRSREWAYGATPLPLFTDSSSARFESGSGNSLPPPVNAPNSALDGGRGGPPPVSNSSRRRAKTSDTESVGNSSRRHIVRPPPREGSSNEPSVAPSWQEAFDPLDLAVHPVYAASAVYEDESDRRVSAVKRDWWQQFLAQRESHGYETSPAMSARLLRYEKSATSTENRRKYGDRRRSSGSTAPAAKRSRTGEPGAAEDSDPGSDVEDTGPPLQRLRGLVRWLYSVRDHINEGLKEADSLVAYLTAHHGDDLSRGP
jgi:hypothetical protein